MTWRVFGRSEPRQARFVDNADGTVTDNATGLMWSKATLSEGAIDPRDAARMCGKLDLAGHMDWRLPSDHELLSLVDRSRYEPAIDIGAFPDTMSDCYWTATECAWASYGAWIVDFSYGMAIYCNGARSDAFVRAVRSLPADWQAEAPSPLRPSW
ncbi:DUF1566 domain-containing protein [Lysobacter enzymogenes]|uniref:Lcl C-terminal domain-containing protein n=1 Tax=Lysobacter enzymogenes TaxID=69 RepID=UPI00099C7B57|nr:DUF1566 domain-containing protein [Lysobacter enzymogenes]UZW62173.1 DUF1566 domain-containing protein [Lysobacter enzymogenes]